MFRLTKKVVMIVLITIAHAGSFLQNQKNCFLLKDKKCIVKETIMKNDYMTYPYNIKVDRCIGRCNNITNPYSKVCVPDIIKNVTVKVLDLISLQNELRSIQFHQSCKCECLLNEIVCNGKQKWDKNNCKCQCLKIENCDIGFSWNFSSCECEECKKAAKLIVKEECKEMVDEVFKQ